jgi:hypothetical protein
MKIFFKPTCRSAICVICLFFLFCNNAFAFFEKDTLAAKIFQETRRELSQVDDVFAIKINSFMKI